MVVVDGERMPMTTRPCSLPLLQMLGVSTQYADASIPVRPVSRLTARRRTYNQGHFCLLLPFGILTEFEKLNASVSGIMHGNMIGWSFRSAP